MKVNFTEPDDEESNDEEDLTEEEGDEDDMEAVEEEEDGGEDEEEDGEEEGGEEEEDEEEDEDEEEEDEVLNFHLGRIILIMAQTAITIFLPDMLFSGLLQLAQKCATQHGACQSLVSFWKNSMGTYHENGKVDCHE